MRIMRLRQLCRQRHQRQHQRLLRQSHQCRLVLTNNKIECEIKDNKLIVSLNFEEDDEVMYVAFRKGNELKKIVTPDIHDMTAEVDLSDTEYDGIDVYVWNGNMKPYAEVKQIEK